MVFSLVDIVTGVQSVEMGTESVDGKSGEPNDSKDSISFDE